MDDRNETVTVDYLYSLAEVLAANPARLDRCAYGGNGHDHHLYVDVALNMDTRAVPDCPSLAGYVNVGSMPFRVFDADQYRDISGYCTGDCEVSRSITAQGVWEPWDSLLFLDLLAQTSSRSGHEFVVDFGCHVGWYTLLAARMGYPVVGVAGDVEQVEAAVVNAERAGVAERVLVEAGWIGPTTGCLPVDPDWRCRVAKIDIEGAEAHALRALRLLTYDQRVDWILAEVSPEFHTAIYFDAFAATGWEAYLVPTKGDDVDGFEADPVGFTLARRQVLPSSVRAQRTFLFRPAA